MKKKIFLTLVMTLMLVLVLALAVSAESVHSGKVDLNQKVTLSSGETVNLFDSEGNALIWYRDNEGALKSIRADIGIDGENKVDYVITGWNGGGGIQGLAAQQIDDVYITVDGVTYDDKSIVVFNIMDDDVVVTSSTKGDFLIGLPVNCMQNLFNNSGNILEYLFLRLDTVAIQATAFKGSSKLKYANLEDLYTLKQIAGSAFMNCSSLGPDLVLPNSITSIGTACFNGCSSLVTARIGDKVSSCGSYDFFMNCTSLTTLYIPGTLTNITINSFKNSPNITTVFYTGDKTAAETFMQKATSSGGNGYVTALTLISNVEYKKLEDKSGKYFVYDYSVCNAFYNGNHELDPEKSNPCAGTCEICKEVALNSNPVHNYVTTIAYANYLANGVKTLTCQNDGCAHKTAPVEITVNPIIPIFRGFSVNNDGDAITFGYVIDYDALDEFAKITGKSVELGFVTAVEAFANGDAYTCDKAVKASIVTWTTDDEANKAVAKYIGADFILRGNWDKMVDLDGDTVAETDVKKVEFYMAGYLMVGGNVTYLNALGSSNTADVVTFNGCNAPEIAE